MKNKFINASYNKLFGWLAYREIRNKILITVLLLFVFRFLATIPVPGIDPGALKNAFSGVSGIFNSLDIFSGGTLSRFSIISIGLGAYINSTLIFQLLGLVFKRLENLQKEGGAGRAKINQWTRFLTVPLAALQSLGIYNLLKSDNLIQSNISTLQLISIVSVATAGAMVLLWIGELMTEQGLGNGISLIIMVGIIARVPGGLISLFSQSTFVGPRDWLIFAVAVCTGIAILLIAILLYRISRFITKRYFIRSIYLLLISSIFLMSLYAVFAKEFIKSKLSYDWLNNTYTFIDHILTKPTILPAVIIIALSAVIIMIIAFNEGTRNIPIQFSRRYKVTKTLLFNKSHLPYRLLIAGVVPIIFASSFLYLPAIMYFFFSKSSINWLKDFVTNTNTFLDQTNWQYWATYFILVFVLTYFWTLNIAFRPKNIAESFRKQGNYINGVRPGEETEIYLLKLVSKLTLLGGLFLGFISILPFFVRGVPGLGSILAGGTSCLIVVAVILDLKRQVAALRASQNYSKYIEN